MGAMRRSALGAALLAAILSGEALSQEEPSWPEFHGPGRRNLSPDRGLLRQWPPEGPRLLWKFSGCGIGYAGVAIAGGRIFTVGDFGDDQCLLALDPGGKLLWKSPHGRAWKGPQPGARAVPTVCGGLLYQLNAHGLLGAFEAETGRPVWTVDLRERFEARPGTWGFAEHVLVEGDLLFCMPGGPRGRVVALDRRTGTLAWANTEIRDRAAYSSPILVDHGGVRQLVLLAHETVLGVEASTGKLLWSHPHPSTCDQNVTRPVFHEGAVFVTSGHRGGGRLVRLAPDSRSAREAWFGTDLDNCHGGVLLLDGVLYGSGCRLYKRGLVAVDWETGKTLFNAPEIGKVSVTWADGRIYALGNDASLALVEVSRAGARVVSRFQPPWRDRPPCLSHPVVCGGRLYVRHLDELLVYDLRAGS